MTAIEFPAFAFDAMGAFYSITHIPRDRHASFGATALDDWVGNWLGTTMFFSHYDRALTQELVSDAGLLVERAEGAQ